VPALAQVVPAPPSEAAPPAPMTAPPETLPPASPPATAPEAVPPATPPATPPSDPNANVPPAPVPPEASGMVPADPNVPRNPAAPEGTAANPTVVGGNMTPPPATPKEYPVCTRTITDSCINPGEGPAARKAKARRRR
jgi:hypothetical protein